MSLDTPGTLGSKLVRAKCLHTTHMHPRAAAWLWLLQALQTAQVGCTVTPHVQIWTVSRVYEDTIEHAATQATISRWRAFRAR